MWWYIWRILAVIVAALIIGLVFKECDDLYDRPVKCECPCGGDNANPNTD
jgi:hypothetical protein